MAEYPEGTIFVPVSPRFAEEMSDWSDLLRVRIVQDDHGVYLQAKRPTPQELRDEADRVEAAFPYLHGKVATDG
jgi:hypothetical protein